MVSLPLKIKHHEKSKKPDVLRLSQVLRPRRRYGPGGHRRRLVPHLLVEEHRRVDVSLRELEVALRDLLPVLAGAGPEGLGEGWKHREGRRKVGGGSGR